MTAIITAPKTEALGPLMITPTVQEYATEDFSSQLVSRSITRFKSGDWGDLDEEDWEMNLDTIRAAEAGNPGGRLMGAYQADGKRLWIITSGYGNQALGQDYCYTVAMHPSEY